MEDGAVIKLMYTADNTPGGGGSGGGGGSSSGGGSGRYGTTTGGPGMTAIPEQEVPLAEAPELAALIEDRINIGIIRYLPCNDCRKQETQG